MHRAMIPVVSSAITACRDLPDKRMLVISFISGDKSYAYDDVPEAVYAALMRAESKGTYVAMNIVKKYPTVPLTKEALGDLLNGVATTTHPTQLTRLSEVFRQLQLKHPVLAYMF